MNAQYDAIAEQYRRSKDAPLRRYVEAYTFMQLVGDVRGKRVLDLACGEGFYSRRIKELGAAEVVGVDVSPAMITLAEQQEQAAPLGIDYVCADVQALPELGSFDLIAAAYLLHYAPDERALLRMCVHIVRSLPAGGRFVALNENPDQAVGQYAGYEQYGFNKTVERPRRDGSKITYFMIADASLFEFHAYHFSRMTYERVFAVAGFRSSAWLPLQLDAAGVDAHGRDYWQEYLANPPIIGLECRV